MLLPNVKTSFKAFQEHIFRPAIEFQKRAGGPAWLRYRLDMAGVVGSNPTRPTISLVRFRDSLYIVDLLTFT